MVAQVGVAAGEHALVAIIAGEDQPLGVPQIADLDQRLDVTDQAWKAWTRGLRCDGPYREVVRRSALILKLLLFSPTGVIAAAATTSLPSGSAATRTGITATLEYVTPPKCSVPTDFAVSSNRLKRRSLRRSRKPRSSVETPTMQMHHPVLEIAFRTTQTGAPYGPNGGRSAFHVVRRRVASR